MVDHNLNYIRAGMLGAIAGDALGVPVEFYSREELKWDPVTDMRAFGTHYQPAGTWSDDSSMLLAAADSLSRGFNLEDMMEMFREWYKRNAYTPYGSVFDIGGATSKAINKYAAGMPAAFCGSFRSHDNGNGSLMRFLPMSIYIREALAAGKQDTRSYYFRINSVSALTHSHPISMMGCGLYTEIVGRLMKDNRSGKSPLQSLDGAHDAVENAYVRHSAGNLFHDNNYTGAFSEYSRLKDIRAFAELPEEEIRSGGYVVSTLEAAVWCLLNTNSYTECVLKAVNLGGDTDTTACVAGGLAGIWYGEDGIPEEWIRILPKLDIIEDIIARFTDRIADFYRG